MLENCKILAALTVVLALVCGCSSQKIRENIGIIKILENNYCVLKNPTFLSAYSNSTFLILDNANLYLLDLNSGYINQFDTTNLLESTRSEFANIQIDSIMNRDFELQILASFPLIAAVGLNSQKSDGNILFYRYFIKLKKDHSYTTIAYPFTLIENRPVFLFRNNSFNPENRIPVGNFRFYCNDTICLVGTIQSISEDKTKEELPYLLVFKRDGNNLNITDSISFPIKEQNVLLSYDSTFNEISYYILFSFFSTHNNIYISANNSIYSYSHPSEAILSTRDDIKCFALLDDNYFLTVEENSRQSFYYRKYNEFKQLVAEFRLNFFKNDHVYAPMFYNDTLFFIYSNNYNFYLAKQSIR